MSDDAPKPPTYLRHKHSGQAYATFAGRDVYLGKHGTPESRERYRRLVREWRANGYQLPSGKDIAVVEVIRAYWTHAKDYYRRDSGNDGDLDALKAALRTLKRLYGNSPAAEFGPLKFRAVRQAMIDAGWSRTYINAQTARIRRLFRWAASHELVPGTLPAALKTVEPLVKGKTKARETVKVLPVPQPQIDAVLPLLSRHLKAMVELQLVTGMRPGELCAMRTRDVDTTGQPWVYRPASHKTEHHGHERVIYLGPKAQAIVAPFLKPDLSAYLFSPAEAEAERREAARSKRRTPTTQGNVAGSNRVKNPRRKPGARYSRESYRKAIARTCDRAFPPPPHLARQPKETAAAWRARLTPEQRKELLQWRREHRWHPHRLRHNASTFLRAQFGVEAAQVILGHKTLKVTELYAEKNVAAARQIMNDVG